MPTPRLPCLILCVHVLAATINGLLADEMISCNAMQSYPFLFGHPVYLVTAKRV